MRKFLGLFIFFIGAVLFLVGCQSDVTGPVDTNSPVSSLSKSGVVESVTGSGSYFIDGKLRLFSFTAQRRSDGSVTGTFNLNRHDVGVKYSGTITAFEVVGNVVYWGGFITNSNTDNPDNGIGAGVVSAAIDNGQGKNSPPDQVTLIVSSTGYTQAVIDEYCYSSITGQFFLTAPVDVEAGNIQIH